MSVSGVHNGNGMSISFWMGWTFIRGEIVRDGYVNSLRFISYFALMLMDSMKLKLSTEMRKSPLGSDSNTSLLKWSDMKHLLMTVMNKSQTHSEIKRWHFVIFFFFICNAKLTTPKLIKIKRHTVSLHHQEAIPTNSQWRFKTFRQHFVSVYSTFQFILALEKVLRNPLQSVLLFSFEHTKVVLVQCHTENGLYTKTPTLNAGLNILWVD